MNHSLHQIEELKKNVELDHIPNDEGLRRLLESHRIQQKTAPPPKLVFTVKDLAETFHVTTRTIYN